MVGRDSRSWKIKLATCLVSVVIGGCSSKESAPKDAASDPRGSEANGCSLQRLACTGLYGPNGEGWAARTLGPGVRAYTPGAQLWSDGLDKSRFILLPPGMKVDTQKMDEWVFPVGTKLWKEFRWQGRRIETRLLWKQAERKWLWTTYRWNAEESEATELTTGEVDVPGTDHHEIPTQRQCANCHDGKKDKVLGFEALALSTEAASGVTLKQLIEEGLLTHPPASVPSVPGTQKERAALEYLHMNCGVSCHNGNLLSLARTSGLMLRLEWAEMASPATTDAYRTAVGAKPVSLLGAGPAGANSLRVTVKQPKDSLVLSRMSSLEKDVRMPPLGTHTVDAQGVAIIQAWIDDLEEAPRAHATP